MGWARMQFKIGPSGTLAGVAQLGCCPIHQKVVGSIPEQGTYGSENRSPRRGKRSNQLMFLSHTDVSVCLSPFPSLKAMKKCPQVRIN